MMAEAELRYPQFQFITTNKPPSDLPIPITETFDFVIVSDVIAAAGLWSALNLRSRYRPDTRVIVTNYSRL